MAMAVGPPAAVAGPAQGPVLGPATHTCATWAGAAAGAAICDMDKRCLQAELAARNVQSGVVDAKFCRVRTERNVPRLRALLQQHLAAPCTHPFPLATLGTTQEEDLCKSIRIGPSNMAAFTGEFIKLFGFDPSPDNLLAHDAPPRGMHITPMCPRTV